MHFGSFAAQIKEFIDQLSPVWLEGHLVDKPAAVFCSGDGGEETTLLSMMIPLLNLGMLPVGLSYGFDVGSPYGRSLSVANTVR